MALDLYWGSGSPYSWRVQLALEYKRLDYVSHELQFSKQEHKSPQLLRGPMQEFLSIFQTMMSRGCF